MSRLTRSPAWRALAAHRKTLTGARIGRYFDADPDRAGSMSVEFGELYLDYSRHLATRETMQLLVALAEQAQVSCWTERMFSGDAINSSEDRPALHVALRSDREAFPESFDVMPEVRQVRARLRDLVEQARAGRLYGATGRPLRAMVNLGIGGSDLGPRMVKRALRALDDGRCTVRFAANADPADLDDALLGLEPSTTGFILASKSFTTVETLDNARRAREWLEAGLSSGAAGPSPDLGAHFIAVTANPGRAREFGIAGERIFPMWDWVGGRYSVWSAVGLPIALAAGFENFEMLLEGARAMDGHFRTAPLPQNMPVVMALLGIWCANFLSAQTHAVIPYSEDLRELPAYLQQLEMESNGKRCDREGRRVDYATAPVIWGLAGTTSQHSVHQLLHQGTQLVPVDFIVAAEAAGNREARSLLLANALAQAAALALGKENPKALHLDYPGNRPSSTILLARLSPQALGQLIALYEHKVFVQGVIWNINSFDQWGVELGKSLAKELLPALTRGEIPQHADPATRALIGRICRSRGN